MSDASSRDSCRCGPGGDSGGSQQGSPPSQLVNGPASGLGRRAFLGGALRTTGAVSFGAVLGFMAGKFGRTEALAWQIDPAKCTQCGNCATDCVLEISAVKAFHNFKLCGYCELCTGFFDPETKDLTSAAENQICPTGAIDRSLVEFPYYEYKIDRDLCIGCGKCVEGCESFGNGSLFLQIDHEVCKHCNECAIAPNCPALAVVRVPLSAPYIPRTEQVPLQAEES